MIKAEKQLEAALTGKPKKTTERKDCSLLTEVANEEQIEFIKN